MIGQSEKSGIEIESEYQLTGHPVYAGFKHLISSNSSFGFLKVNLLKSGSDKKCLMSLSISIYARMITIKYDLLHPKVLT